MKSSVYLSCLILLVAVQVDAQVYSRDASQWFTDSGIIKQFQPLSNVEGDVKLFESEVVADVYFKADKVMNDVPINYDLYFSQLTIEYDKKIYAIDLRLVDHFEVDNTGETFINSIKLKNMEPGILLEKLYESDNLAFYRKKGIKFTDPNYNEALAVGSRDSKISKVVTYVLYEKEEAKPTELKTNKKALKSLENYAEIKEYVKENNLKLDGINEWIKVIEFYENKKYN